MRGIQSYNVSKSDELFEQLFQSLDRRFSLGSDITWNRFSNLERTMRILYLLDQIKRYEGAKTKPPAVLIYEKHVERLYEILNTVSQRMERLQPGDLIMTESAADFPAVAAPGYAIGALDTRKPVERKFDQAQNEPYDVFTLNQNTQGRMRP